MRKRKDHTGITPGQFFFFFPQVSSCPRCDPGQYQLSSRIGNEDRLETYLALLIKMQ